MWEHKFETAETKEIKKSQHTTTHIAYGGLTAARKVYAPVLFSVSRQLVALKPHQWLHAKRCRQYLCLSRLRVIAKSKRHHSELFAKTVWLSLLQNKKRVKPST